MGSAGMRVCSTGDVEPGTARRFDVDGHRVCVVRLGDDWYAIGDRCSHAEASLSEGEIDGAACTIECPKHGSTFSLTTGEPQSLPAIAPVPVYGVRIDGDDVILTVDGGAS